MSIDDNEVLSKIFLDILNEKILLNIYNDKKLYLDSISIDSTNLYKELKMNYNNSLTTEY